MANGQAWIRFTCLFLSTAVTVLSFVNCAQKSATFQPAKESDFHILGPDGDEIPAEAADHSAAHEKLYFNGSGDASTAPRWSNKTINWSYNPAGQPTRFSQEQVLGALQKSIASWESVCGIRWNFQGVTSASQLSHMDNTNVIGWSGSTQYSGATWVRWSRSLYFAESDVDFSNAFISDTTTLEGVANHELGHMLGLSHSDVSESIMFANPYHSISYLFTLRDDDIRGCVDLYGPPGDATPSPTATPSPSPTPTPTATPSPQPQPSPTPPSWQRRPRRR